MSLQLPQNHITMMNCSSSGTRSPYSIVLLLLLLAGLSQVSFSSSSGQWKNHGGGPKNQRHVHPISPSNQWPNHGGGLKNQRHACSDSKINTANAKNLKRKWGFIAGGSITATPAIYDGTLYFPSWHGMLYAVCEKDGSLLWSKNVTLLSGVFDPLISQLFFGLNWTAARATPVVSGDVLLVGTYGPAYILGINRHTGSLLWSTQIDSAVAAIVTQSGVAYKGFYYVGVSSQQEDTPPELCCTFIGKFLKLNIATGAVVWRTLMLPDNGGKKGLYSGASIWGSSPAIDEARGLVYIATGNVYSAPPDIEACAKQQEQSPQVPDPCLRPENHGNSVLALRLDNGHIKWAKSLGPYDAWTISCFLHPPNCPAGPALDYDFGEAPMLVTVPNRTAHGPPTFRDIVVAAQKSGTVWGFDPESGDILWSTVAGPGGSLGGASWGSATDGERVYTNIVNNDGKNFTLVPSSNVTKGGGWVAMDALTGKVIWSRATPNGSPAFGPVTVVNGVLLVTSGSPDVYALDAATGDFLWHSPVNGRSEYGGFSVSSKCAYVGEGRFAVFDGTRFFADISSGTTLSAFCV